MDGGAIGSDGYGRAGSRAELDRAVLRTLQRHGPRPVRELPHRWPLTRQHLRFLVAELVDRGLARVQPAPGPGREPGVAITARGRALLATRTRRSRPAA